MSKRLDDDLAEMVLYCERCGKLFLAVRYDNLCPDCR